MIIMYYTPKRRLRTKLVKFPWTRHFLFCVLPKILNSLVIFEIGQSINYSWVLGLHLEDLKFYNNIFIHITILRLRAIYELQKSNRISAK